MRPQLRSWSDGGGGVAIESSKPMHVLLGERSVTSGMQRRVRQNEMSLIIFHTYEASLQRIPVNACLASSDIRGHMHETEDLDRR